MRRRRYRLAILLVALTTTDCASTDRLSGTAADDHVRLGPKSYQDLKFGATVGQEVDFSCGAAALATLTTYYWDQPLREMDALAALLAPYSEEERKKKKDTGFSFADLISAAHRLGFAAEGAKIAPEELVRVAGPVIVHLDKGTFQHFSVLRRAGHGTYYLSDPVVGAIAMPEGEFVKQYTGFALAVWQTGAGEKRRRDCQAERIGGLHVDDQLEPGRLQY